MLGVPRFYTDDNVFRAKLTLAGEVIYTLLGQLLCKHEYEVMNPLKRKKIEQGERPEPPPIMLVSESKGVVGLLVCLKCDKELSVRIKVIRKMLAKGGESPDERW